MDINRRQNINSIVRKIKQKPELRGLANSIVNSCVQKYLAKSNLSLEKFKKTDIKLLIKKIRSELRNSVGSFEISSKNRAMLLEKNKINQLLKTHKSTRERIRFYLKLRKIIKSLNVKSVLDLGCGLNPIALASSDMRYYAADVKEDEVNLINRFFLKNKINGEAFIYDLKNIKNDLPKCDLCLLLKIFDVLEKKGHKLTEKIISNINCKYLMISFSTKTLSGKPMNHPQRGWIERLLNRLNYKFNLIKTNNEIFYLASKQLRSN